MEFPLVSIIIPTHNRPKLLQRAVKSALNQTYKNFEIIIVDDVGNAPIDTISKDTTHKIQYIRIPETFWISENRNAGLKIANGKYIAWLDDDDIWFDFYLDTLIPIMESDESIGLACANGYIINTLDEVPTRLIFPHLLKEMKGNLFKQTIWDCFTLPSLMMTRKDIFDKTNVYQNIRGEDLDIIIKISAVSNMYYTPKLCGVWYRKLHNGSASELMQSTLSNRLRILLPIIQCLNETRIMATKLGRKFSGQERVAMFLQTYYYHCYIIAISFMFHGEDRYKKLREILKLYPLLFPLTLLAPFCSYKIVRDYGQKIKRKLI